MLSRNDKIFFGKEIFEDCEIFVEKYVARDDQLYSTAIISSKVSKLPERYQDIPIISRLVTLIGDYTGYQYIFDVTFVSSVFILWCIVSNSNYFYHLFNF